MRGVAALALSAILAADTLALRVFHAPWPPLEAIRPSHESAAEIAGFLSLGMRRLAADIEFMRLLIYFGSSEDRGEAEEHVHESGPASYPELAPRVLRILEIDPYFRYAAEYGAGALAFNVHRPAEAVDVLTHALARDPKNWRYRAYLAAIAFDKQGKPELVRAQLSTVADAPEAPTMLKHLLAFLDLRLGRRAEAVRLYREILRSRDKGYAELARRALRRLGAPEAG